MTDNRLERPSAFSLALNFLPLAYIVIGASIGFAELESTGARTAFLLVWIYLAPPVAGRLILTFFGRPHGTLGQHERGYRVWWALTQLQMPFNRLPMLEEALRCAPGLYPLWIALWGGRLSPFAYVAPGVVIADRYLVEIGAGAVIGMKAALTGHMAIRDAEGRWQVVIGAPRVEAQAIMGGASGLGPGAVLAAGALLPAGRRIGPFDRWPRARAQVSEP